MIEEKYPGIDRDSLERLFAQMKVEKTYRLQKGDDFEISNKSVSAAAYKFFGAGAVQCQTIRDSDDIWITPKKPTRKR